MQPNEIPGLNRLISTYPSLYSSRFTTTPAFQFNHEWSHPLCSNFHIYPQIQVPQTSSLSNNSTSDEADEQQLNLINERKQRRMISNRESARRSRMRKQRQLNELCSHVVWLRNENHQLIDKLNHVSESYDRVVQENAQLKEEASELRQMIDDMQLKTHFSSFRDHENTPCNTAHLRAESPYSSIAGSMDLLG